MNKCYKVVRRLKDGRLVSEFADDRTYPQLEYRIGKVTTSPNGMGIFCRRDLESAKSSANFLGNPYVAVEVHVAHGIGEEVKFWGSDHGMINYPAIKLGRKVYTIR